MVTTSPLVAELVTGFADLADAVTSEISRLTAERDHAQSQLVDARALIEALLDRLSHAPAAVPVDLQPVREFSRPRRYGVELRCKCGATFITAPYLVRVCAACQRLRYSTVTAKARAGRRQLAQDAHRRTA